MAKTILIAAILGCIHYKGEEHVAGSKPFPCDAKEAKRLIDLGVAAEPVEETEQTDTTISDLLAAIAAAETEEALMALMPEQDPGAEIAAAFEARLAELGAA
jgi:hypothetical protein